MNPSLIKDSTHIDWAAFKDTRAKVQLADQSHVSGWVVEFSQEFLILEMKLSDAMLEKLKGERLSITLNEHRQSAKFTGKFVGRRNNQFQIKFDSVIAIGRPTEKMRRLSKKVTATITVEGETHTVFLIDFGPFGAGFTCLNSFEPRSTATINFISPKGNVEVDGVLVYCYFEADSNGFRMGMSFGDNVPRNISARILEL